MAPPNWTPTTSSLGYSLKFLDDIILLKSIAFFIFVDAKTHEEGRVAKDDK